MILIRDKKNPTQGLKDQSDIYLKSFASVPSWSPTIIFGILKPQWPVEGYKDEKLGIFVGLY